MQRILLLDTCAAIWLANQNPLSEACLQLMREARISREPIMLSPISAWEVGLLVSRGRLPLQMEPGVWFRALTELPGMQLAAMPPEVLIQASFLPGDPPRDPVDRIIAATARAFGYRVITRDRLLLDYAESGHMEAIAC